MRILLPQGAGAARRTGRRACLAACLLGIESAAISQNVTVSAGEAGLGRIVSAASGTTTFTFDASSGAVSKVGNGIRLSSGSVHSLVTLSCGSQGTCNTSNVIVTVGPTGTPSGRAGPLSAITIAMGSAVLVNPPTGLDTVTFTIQPIGRNSSKTFYVGASIPIYGNESASPTGSAQSWFQVTAQTTAINSGTGVVSATVSRPLSFSSASALSFGRVMPPSTGSGTVQISPDGARTTTGGARVLASPAPSAAQFTVNGEGGQTVSISVPTSFVMSGPSSITVSTATNASATATLSGTLGAAGTYSFGVGGSLPLSSSSPAGTYSGTFTVTANYN